MGLLSRQAQDYCLSGLFFVTFWPYINHFSYILFATQGLLCQSAARTGFGTFSSITAFLLSSSLPSANMLLQCPGIDYPFVCHFAMSPFSQESNFGSPTLLVFFELVMAATQPLHLFFAHSEPRACLVQATWSPTISALGEARNQPHTSSVGFPSSQNIKELQEERRSLLSKDQQFSTF